MFACNYHKAGAGCEIGTFIQLLFGASWEGCGVGQGRASGLLVAVFVRARVCVCDISPGRTR